MKGRQEGGRRREGGVLVGRGIARWLAGWLAQSLAQSMSYSMEPLSSEEAWRPSWVSGLVS